MYFISEDNKVYVKTEKGFREVKVTRDDDGLIAIENLKDTSTVKVKEICILEEVVARYLTVEEVGEQEPQLPTEEKEPKKSKK
jgi:hypothetical protein